MIQTGHRTLSRALAVLVALATLAGAALVFTIPRGADAVNGFSDTPPWAAAQINWLVENAIADGYPTNPPTFEPDGSITRAQAAYWFANYNRRTSIVQGIEDDPGPSIAFQNTTTCPPGRRAIGGGGSTSTSNLFITDSYPVNLDTGWTVRWETDNDVTADPSFVRVWALCMPTDP